MGASDQLGFDHLILHQYTESAYLQYAMATVRDRALAQVQDGQKPVQRRILYAMRQLGLGSNAKPVKSARVVGDVLGKFHPHGDSAAYEAMVRMAQPFSLRYPLIQGQGNFGSRDGDSAAAMRYTEARLTPIAELLLSELDSGTVDFVPNYDGSFQEPSLLPARLPFLLLNGSMGIAVGMACDIPPHNLSEVAQAAKLVLRNPQASLDEVLSVLPGPDFPDGGQLISSPQEIRAAYTSGRGSLRMRARWSREELARGQYQIVIHELPYQVSVKRVLEQIEALASPQVPSGKKTITPQQAVLKQGAMALIESAADESDQDQAIRLIVAPRTSKVDAHELMAFLFANTDLETSVTVNMTAISEDGNPRTQGLLSLLTQWCAFRMQTVRRRTEHELGLVESRIHLLQGRMIVYLKVDEVIRVIREAQEPRAALMEQFGLSEVQADDILEMRLRALAGLEGLRIEKELGERLAEQARLRDLLDRPEALLDLVADEIDHDRAKFGDERRTLLLPTPRAASTASTARHVVDEPITIAVSRNLWVRAKAGHDVADDSFTFKPGDGRLATLPARTSGEFCVLDAAGRAYSVASSAIPLGRGDGVPLTALIELQPGCPPAHFVPCEDNRRYAFISSDGFGFQSPARSLSTRLKAGKAFISLSEAATLLPPVALPSEEAGYLAIGASDGKLLVFPLAELKTLSNGGKGVMLMALSEGACVSAAAYLPELVLRATLLAPNGQSCEVELSGEVLQKYVLHRARRGASLPKKQVWTVLAQT